MEELSQLLLLLFLVVSQHKAETKAPPFTASEYPVSQYQVTIGKHVHGDAEIKVVEVKKKKPDDTPPSYCRAWLDVKKNGRLLKRVYYGDFEPVGWKYGIFVPARQPLEDFFIVLKEGDYDGHLLLITKNGEVFDLPGGLFFVTPNKHFLVSEYSSDEPKLIIFDLLKRQITAKFETFPEVGSWYQDDIGYFFTEFENPKQVDRLDLRGGRLVPQQGLTPNREKARKLKYDFDPRDKVDCVALPQ